MPALFHSVYEPNMCIIRTLTDFIRAVYGSLPTLYWTHTPRTDPTRAASFAGRNCCLCDRRYSRWCGHHHLELNELFWSNFSIHLDVAEYVGPRQEVRA